MNKFYNELANWWYLISAPEDYQDEAHFFLSQLQPITQYAPVTLLELGSGGGNNAYHMKHTFQQVTLSDLSPQMLALSKTLNSDCTHIVGDMRTLRLKQTFDAVFIHDAIDYMTTRDDLRQTLLTAYSHCKPNGMCLFAPDHIKETFEPSTEHGGHDGDSRQARYLEWSYDPDPDDETYCTDYAFILHEDGKAPRIEHELHTLGLFSRQNWIQLMQDIGFTVSAIEDDYERTIFIGRK
ncbi:MAG: class I SAM-dependent methyltransferase [Anaerolineae bacterium]